MKIAFLRTIDVLLGLLVCTYLCAILAEGVIGKNTDLTLIFAVAMALPAIAILALLLAALIHKLAQKLSRETLLLLVIATLVLLGYLTMIQLIPGGQPVRQVDPGHWYHPIVW